MERNNYYKGLNIDQVQFADSLGEAAFAHWVNHGSSDPRLLDQSSFDMWIQGGGTKHALNQMIENAHALSRTGQRSPQSDGFSLAANLVWIPEYAQSSVMTEMWTSAVEKFSAKYPQFIQNTENLVVLKKFLEANGGRNPGMGVKPCLENLEVYFKTCFSQLYLRHTKKTVTLADAPTTEGAAQSLRPAAQPGQAYNPLLYADIQRKEKQLAAKKAAATAKAQSPYARPKLESSLVETILSPRDVANLSADETALFMQPMSFPGVTDSADEYVQSEEFRAETPAPKSRREREQTPAQISREVEVFCNAYPDYAKYAQGGVYGGLNKIVLDKIDSWGFLVSSQSLLDGFTWAASEGLIPKAVDRADGQVASFHVTPDLNPPPSAANVGSIRYHGKRVRDMSSQELQTSLNESDDFRKLVDGAA